MTWFPEEYDVGVFIGRKESEQCHAGFETHSRKLISNENFWPSFLPKDFLISGLLMEIRFLKSNHIQIIKLFKPFRLWIIVSSKTIGVFSVIWRISGIRNFYFSGFKFYGSQKEMFLDIEIFICIFLKCAMICWKKLVSKKCFYISWTFMIVQSLLSHCILWEHRENS